MNHLEKLFIHNEAESDVGVIAEVTKAAFTNHLYSRGTETFIINGLRAVSFPLNVLFQRGSLNVVVRP